MNAAEIQTTTVSHSLQTKSEEQRTPFFDNKGANSVLTNDGKDSHFFDNTSSNSNKKIPFFSRPLVQTKLTIGQPGDKYEDEADAMADQVVQRLADNNNGSDQQSVLKNHIAIQRKPIFESEAEPRVQAKPLNGNSLNTTNIQPKCAECEQEKQIQEKENIGEEEQLQMKPIFDSAAPPPDDNSIQRKCAECAHEEKILQSKAVLGEEQTLQAKAEVGPFPTPCLESSLQSSKGGGSHLPEDTRSQMEVAFGTDFSGVQVHTDSSAVQMNKELGAQAFTIGTDIYFNAGKYEPGSTVGQRLLGHELTHTVQQNNGIKAIQKQVRQPAGACGSPTRQQIQDVTDELNAGIERMEGYELRPEIIIGDGQSPEIRGNIVAHIRYTIGLARNLVTDLSADGRLNFCVMDNPCGGPDACYIYVNEEIRVKPLIFNTAGRIEMAILLHEYKHLNQDRAHAYQVTGSRRARRHEAADELNLEYEANLTEAIFNGNHINLSQVPRQPETSSPPGMLEERTGGSVPEMDQEAIPREVLEFAATHSSGDRPQPADIPHLSRGYRTQISRNAPTVYYPVEYTQNNHLILRTLIGNSVDLGEFSDISIGAALPVTNAFWSSSEAHIYEQGNYRRGTLIIYRETQGETQILNRLLIPSRPRSTGQYIEPTQPIEERPIRPPRGISW